MITAGIDAGSRATKVVLIDSESGRIIGSGIGDQVIEQGRLARELFERVCREIGITPPEGSHVVATGYGRDAVLIAGSRVTEITCHAAGVVHLVPDTRTIIEIGGQDSKCVFLDECGRVRDFMMNDRCAAGSGRFLEMVATKLGVSLASLGDLGHSSREPAVISSMCVVFAETEIIGLLAQGCPPADIAAGIQNSIASRVASMLGRHWKPPVCFTGGVALQKGMVQALQRAISCEIDICSVPVFTGALGAAIIAAQKASPEIAQTRAVP